MVSILKLDIARMQSACWQRSRGAIAQHGGNLLEVSQYTDVNTGWFFARLAIEKGHEPWHPDTFIQAFRARCFPTARRLVDATRRMEDAHGHPRQQTGTCLVDLLWRWRSGELGIDVPLVISNHQTCRTLVSANRFPSRLSLSTQENRCVRRKWELLQEAPSRIGRARAVHADFAGPALRSLCGRIINIYHSFLPAFVGANPTSERSNAG